MAHAPHDPIDDVLFAKASSWFARLHADDVTAEERRQFERWRTQSPTHARAWDEVRELFDDLHAPATAVRDRLKRCGEYPFAPARVANTASHSSRRHLGESLTRSAVVALMIVCVVMTALWAPGTYQNLASDYYTGKGEQQRITLADSSHVVLNTDSAIAVELSDDQRRLTLLRGEAFFEILPDPKRPAAVISHQGEIHVVGTGFSVAQRGEHTVVTVATGAVDVWHASRLADPIPVHAGQQVRYNAQGTSTVMSINLSEELAWRHGQIVFQQKPLSEVIDAVNRYRPGRIFIVKPSIRHQPVTGAFDIQRFDHLFETLRLGLGVHATALTPYLILLH
jgi:transmembrane sensor